jgi:hypothetical protein
MPSGRASEREVDRAALMRTVFQQLRCRDLLDSGDVGLMWERAAVICPRLDRSGGVRLPGCRLVALGLDHSVGEDGYAPERPLAIR